MVDRVKPGKKKVSAGGNYFSAPKKDIPFIRTGSKLLDLALGGGWARYRIANIVGDKSTGKTLLAIEACANFHAALPKGRIRYRETESAFDNDYAKAIGMPVDKVDFGDPLDTVEDLFDDLKAICKGAKGEELVIVDSLDSLSDRDELERGFDEASYGGQKAKYMSKMFRMLRRDLASNKVTLIINSQIRDKMNAGYGKKTTRSGGRALDFYATHIVDLGYTGRVMKTVSNIKRPAGIKVSAFVSKNKISIPFRGADFRIMFGYGIDDTISCLEWLKLAGRGKSIELKSVKEHTEKLRKMSDDDYANEVKRIHVAVETNWYDIERGFVPDRPPKYGAAT